jgi:hypothetical protein
MRLNYSALLVMVWVACGPAGGCGRAELAGVIGDGDSDRTDSGLPASAGRGPAPVAADPRGRADDEDDDPVDSDPDASASLECGRGTSAAALRLHVEFECGSVTVYTCKDLSNIVLEFEDGTRQRFEGLKGRRNVFAGTGSFAGKRIVRVWVKAGPNHSGDGPGYGERVETTVDLERCDAPQAGSGGSCGGPDVSCGPEGAAGSGGTAGASNPD